MNRARPGVPVEIFDPVGTVSRRTLPSFSTVSIDSNNLIFLNPNNSLRHVSSVSVLIFTTYSDSNEAANLFTVDALLCVPKPRTNAAHHAVYVSSVTSSHNLRLHLSQRRYGVNVFDKPVFDE